MRSDTRVESTTCDRPRSDADGSLRRIDLAVSGGECQPTAHGGVHCRPTNTRCTACGHRLDAVQNFTDDPLIECPECGGALRKVYGAVGIVLKGSGFYKTDSRAAAVGNGSGKKAADSSSSDGAADSSSKKDSGSDKGGSDKGGSDKGGSDKGGSDKGGSDKGRLREVELEQGRHAGVGERRLSQSPLRAMSAMASV